MKRWLLLGLALLLVLAFIGLGRWQLGRAHQKEAQIATAEAVLGARVAAPLAAQAARSGGELAWVEGAGHWLPEPVLLLDNQRRGGQVGVRVFRVFEAVAGPSFLVDLGWLALPPDRTLPPVAAMAPELTVLRGLLAPPPSAGLAMGPDRVESAPGVWLMTRMDVPALAQSLQRPLADRVVRLDPTLSLGYARDLDLLSNTLSPEKHRGYALQWFGLAAALACLSLYVSLRKRHD